MRLSQRWWHSLVSPCCTSSVMLRIISPASTSPTGKLLLPGPKQTDAHSSAGVLFQNLVSCLLWQHLKALWAHFNNATVPDGRQQHYGCLIKYLNIVIYAKAVLHALSVKSKMANGLKSIYRNWFGLINISHFILNLPKFMQLIICIHYGSKVWTQ